MEQKIFKSLVMMAAVMAMCVTLFSCQKEEITIDELFQAIRSLEIISIRLDSDDNLVRTPRQ